MVNAEDVIGIHKYLAEIGIPIWLTGGWGIDALLGEQTRPHKDLDVIMLLDDVTRVWVLLGGEGFHLKMVWEENHWVLDTLGNKVATAFVLQDSEGREFDAHAMRLDNQGNGIPEWEADDGFIFKEEDLAGTGMIAGTTVQCITPEKQMACHMGYEIPDVQLRDMDLLHEKFDVEYPDQDSPPGFV